jgi:hypothetical protein
MTFLQPRVTTREAVKRKSPKGFAILRDGFIGTPYFAYRPGK